ncbi:hypothetical protein K2X30_10655 [bacterium]|nr:hypothetical protein [bacterium]
MKVGIIGDFEQNVCYLAGGKACFDAFRRVWEPKLKAGQGLDVPRFIYSKLACQSGSAQACDAWKLSIKNEMTRFGQMCKPGLTKECSEAGYYYTIFGEYEKALKAFQQGCPPSADPKDCALFTQFLDRLNPKVPEQKKILSRGTAYLQKMTKSKQ